MNPSTRLTKTRRTDVTCVACRREEAEYVIVLSNGTETDSGIHQKCAEQVRGSS